MRDAIIIISIILIIIVGDLMMQNYLSKTTEELLTDLNKLKDKAIKTKEKNERDEIITLANNVNKKWQEISKIWSIIIVHQEIDNLEQAFTRAKSSIENGDLDEAIPEIEEAIFFTNHVRDRERLTLKNIF